MLIADLHIHSKYSRATSKDCVPEALDFWARRKGISLVGTGDFTHPAWRSELSDKLVPAEEGLYRLRDHERVHQEAEPEGDPRFVVTGEISSIYKKDGRVRKVHNLILLPSLAAADTLSRKLEAIGNIHSDGRPILGLDSRDLLEITLESCPEAVFIPAHIWTPHFSLFGAFSGFDTIEACFGDLTPHIHALETGLSSDPPMNWRLSALDGCQLVSNSDAHSPAKLGREANLLDIAPSYPALRKALETGEGLAGTIEFFPEEGKYHLDGHRNCRACLTPAETAANRGLCPVCGKKLTIGVLHRVEELADRPEGYLKPDAKGFESLAPLPEVIAASEGGSATGKKVGEKYAALLRELGPEFYILRQAPLEDIGRVAGGLVAEGIRRLRLGQVTRTPGYDGAYGVIGLLDPAERERLGGQVSLFGAGPEGPKRKRGRPAGRGSAPAAPAHSGAGETLNARQALAVTAEDRAVAVVAGPGTGKTKTLVARIAYLVEHRGVKPHEITAVTFTNKAAAELRERLERRLGGRGSAGMTVGTFHSICLDLLSERPQGARLVGSYEALDVAGEVCAGLDAKLTPGKLLEGVSRRKNGLDTDVPEAACGAYCQRLRYLGLLDFDDLLTETLELWREGAPARGAEKRFHHLLVDEFQDCNAVQYELIRAWGRKGESLFVIGDPDQAIYGFRGSDPACFDKLEADFPDLREVRLTMNYRSTPEIVSAALPVIGRNGGAPRELEAAAPGGAPVRLLEAEGDLPEAIFVAKEIARMVGGVDMLEAGRGSARDLETVRSFGDFAVLCRTRRQLGLLEDCLGRDGIPCVVAGRDDFLTDGAVRGALCQLRHLVDPDDALALRGALGLNFGCPPDLCASVAAQWPLLAGEPEERVRALLALYAQVPYIEQWGSLELELLPRARREKPRRLLERIVEGAESGAVERLLNMAVFYQDGADLLQNLTLGQESDLLRSAGLVYDAGAVRLMTLHASKGLEFPVVFLCGVKAGTVPLESERRPADEAEERRLFYVGMTRARDELVILTRRREPSRFLEDLPEKGVERGGALPGRPKAEGVQLSLF